MQQKEFKPKYVKRVLVPRKKIEKEIVGAARWVEKTYKHSKKPPVLVAVLNGAIPFFGNLVMHLKMDVHFDCLIVELYGKRFSPASKPKIITDLGINIRGRDVLLIDDVVDSSKTLMSLIAFLKQRKPKSIKTMVLVDKPDGRKNNYRPDYACLTIKGNPFIIGWGLDVKEYGRTIPFIAEVNKKYKF